MFSLKNVPVSKNGKRYGLLPSSKNSNTQKKVLGKAHSIFKLDNDDEEDASEKQNVRRMIDDETSRRRKQKQLKEMYSTAIEEDSTVFQYDEVYDDVSSSASQKKIQDEAKSLKKEKNRNSRYIGSLMKQAQLRLIEKDRIYERKLQKEAEIEAKERGEAEMKFVTGAYKDKLKEQKRWELEEKAEEEFEEATSAQKIGMGAFYSSLLTKNIAMGGDVEKSARSAFTSGSRLNDKMNSSSVYNEEADVKVKQSDSLEKRHLQKSSREHRSQKQSHSSREVNKAEYSSKEDTFSQESTLSQKQKDRLNSRMEKRRSKDRCSEKEQQRQNRTTHQEPDRQPTKRLKSESEEPNKESRKDVHSTRKDEKTDKVDKKTAIASAKERYLQRKKQSLSTSS